MVNLSQILLPLLFLSSATRPRQTVHGRSTDPSALDRLRSCICGGKAMDISEIKETVPCSSDIMTCEEGVMVVESRPWCDLPFELLDLILQKLPWACYPYVALVCKRWSEVASPVYPADDCPLLVHYKKWADGIIRYYSPSSGKTFIVERPVIDLSGTKFYFSRDGWLLLYKKREVLLYNPISGICHEFPGLRHYNFNGIAFSGCPGKDDCMIFAIDSRFKDHVYISIYDKGAWISDIQYRNSLPFLMAEVSHPVCCEGLFYCLGIKGRLGVYDPPKNIWTVLEKPDVIEKYEESFLVESNGEILMVLLGKPMSPIKVCWLNRTKMEWEEVKNLEAKTVFAGSGMSLSTTKSPRRMKNKVYLPRIQGVPETIAADVRLCQGRIFFVPKAKGRTTNRASGHSLCYCHSLDTGEQVKYYESRELLYSIWFEPTLKVEPSPCSSLLI